MFYRRILKHLYISLTCNLMKGLSSYNPLPISVCMQLHTPTSERLCLAANPLRASTLCPSNCLPSWLTSSTDPGLMWDLFEMVSAVKRRWPPPRGYPVNTQWQPLTASAGCNRHLCEQKIKLWRGYGCVCNRSVCCTLVSDKCCFVSGSLVGCLTLGHGLTSFFEIVQRNADCVCSFYHLNYQPTLQTCGPHVMLDFCWVSTKPQRNVLIDLWGVSYSLSSSCCFPSCKLYIIKRCSRRSSCAKTWKQTDSDNLSDGLLLGSSYAASSARVALHFRPTILSHLALFLQFVVKHISLNSLRSSALCTLFFSAFIFFSCPPLLPFLHASSFIPPPTTLRLSECRRAAVAEGCSTLIIQGHLRGFNRFTGIWLIWFWPLVLLSFRQMMNSIVSGTKQDIVQHGIIKELDKPQLRTWDLFFL